MKWIMKKILFILLPLFFNINAKYVYVDGKPYELQEIDLKGCKLRRYEGLRYTYYKIPLILEYEPQKSLKISDEFFLKINEDNRFGLGSFDFKYFGGIYLKTSNGIYTYLRKIVELSSLESIVYFYRFEKTIQNQNDEKSKRFLSDIFNLYQSNQKILEDKNKKKSCFGITCLGIKWKNYYF